jgi:hypothetical protein
MTLRQDVLKSNCPSTADIIGGPRTPVGCAFRRDRDASVRSARKVQIADSVALFVGADGEHARREIEHSVLNVDAVSLGAILFERLDKGVISSPRAKPRSCAPGHQLSRSGKHDASFRFTHFSHAPVPPERQNAFVGKLRRIGSRTRVNAPSRPGSYPFRDRWEVRRSGS